MELFRAAPGGLQLQLSHLPGVGPPLSGTGFSFKHTHKSFSKNKVLWSTYQQVDLVTSALMAPSHRFVTDVST